MDTLDPYHIIKTGLEDRAKVLEERIIEYKQKIIMEDCLSEVWILKYNVEIIEDQLNRCYDKHEEMARNMRIRSKIFEPPLWFPESSNPKKGLWKRLFGI